MSNFEKFRKYIWYDGKLVAPEDATLSVMAHTLHYGSGFFEGIRAYKTGSGKVAIFRLKEHVDRLINSCKVYYVDLPYTKEEIMEAIKSVVRENDFEDCYIRPLVFIGEGFNTITITDDLKIHLMISAWELKGGNDSYTLSISSYRRFMSSQVPMQAKAIGNYMNSTLIRAEAKRKGDTDGIALDMQGYISEASTSNIFLVKDNVIYTPDLSSSILNGLTRQTVITIAKNLGYEVCERKIARDELYLADEVFLTGTASEVKYVTEIDKIKVGNSNGNYPISNELINAFKSCVRTGCVETSDIDFVYTKWLDYVK